VADAVLTGCLAAGCLALLLISDAYAGYTEKEREIDMALYHANMKLQLQNAAGPGGDESNTPLGQIKMPQGMSPNQWYLWALGNDRKTPLTEDQDKALTAWIDEYEKKYPPADVPYYSQMHNALIEDAAKDPDLRRILDASPTGLDPVRWYLDWAGKESQPKDSGLSNGDWHKLKEWIVHYITEHNQQPNIAGGGGGSDNNNNNNNNNNKKPTHQQIVDCAAALLDLKTAQADLDKKISTGCRQRANP
jgi:hypothetical protein